MERTDSMQEQTSGRMTVGCCLDLAAMVENESRKFGSQDTR